MERILNIRAGLEGPHRGAGGAKRGFRNILRGARVRGGAFLNTEAEAEGEMTLIRIISAS
jgi:hypothetical protein